ncbi:hypothetical protein O181_128960, partial [Austropuccinia psidii MF-1]|nr:hypothetical protein [Austropuccinia psidii MF-1]
SLIRQSSSESEASESSIEIQTSPAPRGSITKEPFKGSAEVEVTTPSNKMELDQDIQVINRKDNNVSPEERHKWRMPELPPVPKGNNRDIPVSVQELVYGSKTETVGTFPKSLDRHHELMSSSEEVHGAKKDRGTSELIRSWTKARKTARWKLPKPPQAKSPSTSAKQTQANRKDQPEWQAKGKGKGKAQVEQALPTELQDFQEREDLHGQCVEYGKNSDGIQKQGRGKIEPISSK